MDAAPLNLLPVESRAKIMRLESGAELSRAALLASADALDADNVPLSRLKHREAQLVAAIDGATNARDKASAEAALTALREGEMAPVAARVEHRKQTKARAEAELREFDFLHEVRTWLGEHRLARLHAGAKPLVRVIPPKVGKVANFPDEVAKSRAQIAAKADEIEAARLAPVPVKDQLSSVISDLDRRAERGKPDYDNRRRDRSPIDLGRMLGEHYIGDTFAWLHRDAIADRLRQIIGTRDLPGALSDADRERTIAKLQAEKLHLERVEESLIVAAEAQGQRIARRRDCDPRAILEVE